MAASTPPPADPTDVVGRRAVAFLIDVVLVGLVGLVVFAALRYRTYSDVHVDACSLLRKTADNPICLKLGSRVFLWHAGAAKTAILVMVFLGFLNNVVLQSITGSTVGKMCFRLSVVDENGAKMHPLRMFGRWLFLIVDVGFCLVGCVMVPATHPHRRIGDFVFGSYVVAMRDVGRPVIVGAASARDAAVTAGTPANWTTPPAPASATKAAPAAAMATSPQLQTPPGTAPTAPGEWGAVARPAPVVRSPQWATPPPTEPGAPPSSIESTTSPKWAAPPLAPKDEEDADDEKDGEAVESKADDEAKPKRKPRAKAKDDKAKDDKTEDDKVEDDKVEDDKVEDDKVEDEEAEAGDADVEENADAEEHAEAIDAESDADEEPDGEIVADGEPDVEPTDTDAATATPADEVVEPEPEVEPEVSEWSPVAKARKRRGAKAGATKAADASWWEAALSSGDSEAEVEAEADEK